MKKLIFLTTIILFFSIFSYSQDRFQGDLSFKNMTNLSMNVTVESETICFEGNHSNFLEYNRLHIIQNGNTYRRYGPNHSNYLEWQIAKHEFSVGSAQYDMAFCSGNPNPSLKVYGFGKYLITITTPNKIYKFYFNNLDSEYGNAINGLTYGNDFVITFLGENQQLSFWGIACGEIGISEYNPQNPIPELKVWELIQNSTEPLETKFYVSSTPFGYSLKSAQEYLDSYKSSMYIGPHIILDKVYPSDPYDQSVFPYSETTERGYNTFSWEYSDNGQPITYNYYDNPPIPSNQNDPGKTYVTPAIYVANGVFMSGTNFIAEAGNIFELGANNKFWISSFATNQEEGVTGDALTFKKNSHLTMGINSKIQTCRMGKFIDEGSIKEFSSGNILRAWGSTDNGWSFLSEIKFTGNNEIHTINNGARIEIDANASLTIGNNTTLLFDGQNTCLQLKPGSHINLGANSKLIFQNGAVLEATNIVFNCQDQGNNWSGIDLINAGNCTITGCSFSNSSIPINIKNNQSNAGVNKVITNNIFTLTGSSSDRGIYADNVFSLNASNNIFNLGTSGIGIYIRNYYNTNSSIGEGNNNTYSLNILHNTFNYGSISLILASYATALTPYTVNGNTFNNNSYIGLLGRMMSGSVKNNTVNGVLSRAFHFYNSNPDLYNNTVNSGKNILSGSMSVVNLSPVKTTEGLVWQAGFNNMTANGQDNIEYNFGNINLDEGRNSFTRSGSCYHLYGFMNTYGNIYYARNNCFNYSNNPVAYLLNLNSEVINIVNQPSSYDCSIYPLTPISWIVRDIGYGQYDSTKVTAAPSGSQLTSEDLLLSQASVNFGSGNYFDALNNYKTFINNYPDNQNLIECLYNLYVCHEQIDTLGTQASKDILYGNLLSYFNEKISSGLYSAEFNDVAYNLSLNCSAQIQDYNAACDGFEFLSLYHPNPDTRLLASWDYAEVQALIGTGGSISSKEEKMTTEEFLKYRTKRMNNLIKSDPIKQKMKETYSKTSKKREENNIKKFANLSKEDAKKKIQSLKSEENKLIDKVLNNLKTSKTLTSVEKNKKQLEDLLLAAGITDLNVKTQVTDNVIPQNYELLQNYPNPFNPVTNIKFQIPKDGFISLKVYDITGREITKLINEVKQAGSYTVIFNGSNFASGVYFYRIQAGDFVQVKKMVLIK